MASVFGGEPHFLSSGFVVKEGFRRGSVAWSLWLRFLEGGLTVLWLRRVLDVAWWLGACGFGFGRGALHFLVVVWRWFCG